MQQILEVLRDTVMPWARRGELRVFPDPKFQIISPGQFWELATMPTPARPYYEWMWMISGEGSMRLGDSIYRLRAGDFCLCPPSVDRVTVYNRETPDFTTLGFAYWPGTIHAHLFHYKPFGNWNAPAHWRTYGSPASGTLLASLHHEISANYPHKAETLQGLILQVITASLRDLEAASDGPSIPSNTDSAVTLVLHLLHERYDYNWTLNALAREAHLNPRYLATLFKARTGQTIFGTLRDIRIERAKSLLLEGTLPLDKIARAVGYRSSDRFARAFRETAGQPPTRYGKSTVDS